MGNIEGLRKLERTDYLMGNDVPARPATPQVESAMDYEDGRTHTRVCSNLLVSSCKQRSSAYQPAFFAFFLGGLFRAPSRL